MWTDVDLIGPAGPTLEGTIRIANARAVRDTDTAAADLSSAATWCVETMQLAAPAAVVAFGLQTSSAWICTSVHLPLVAMSAVALLSAFAIVSAVLGSDVEQSNAATPVSLPLLMAL